MLPHFTPRDSLVTQGSDIHRSTPGLRKIRVAHPPPFHLHIHWEAILNRTESVYAEWSVIINRDSRKIHVWAQRHCFNLSTPISFRLIHLPQVPSQFDEGLRMDCLGLVSMWSCKCKLWKHLDMAPIAQSKRPYGTVLLLSDAVQHVAYVIAGKTWFDSAKGEILFRHQCQPPSPSLIRSSLSPPHSYAWYIKFIEQEKADCLASAWTLREICRRYEVPSDLSHLESGLWCYFRLFAGIVLESGLYSSIPLSLWVLIRKVKVRYWYMVQRIFCPESSNYHQMRPNTALSTTILTSNTQTLTPHT